jgi:uncharacterized glyoxalase superfamily protein PhnB
MIKFKIGDIICPFNYKIIYEKENMMPINFKPDGWQSVIPYLIVDDVVKEIDWIINTFGGTEIDRSTLPDGTINHGEVRIGDCVVMMGKSSERHQVYKQMLYVYVENCDSVYKKALDTGSESVSEPRDEFYGDRSAGVKDPHGNEWWIGTHVEDVSPEEIQRRMAELKK